MEVPQKTIEERIQEAKEKSQNVKAVYMTYGVAADRGAPATRLRNSILKLVEETEINAVVIDVKESSGVTTSKSLKETVDEFHQKGAWVIARMTMMRDNSQVKNHPEYYIQTKSGELWKDNHKNHWLDPANQDMWRYQADAVKKAIDLGFDEIQYDYVRFPSDGNMKDIAYPVYDVSVPRYVVIRDFLHYMNGELKSYKPEIILSADLFGYVAVMTEDLTIGQRLVDIGDSVDYISLMVYPSHYYSGFYVGKDYARDLPSLYIPYKDKDVTKVASNHPYEIIYRSMLIGQDVLLGKNPFAKPKPHATSTSATSTPETTKPISGAKMRPWLQDFNLGADTSRGIYYDVTKVRDQINAANDAGTSGWLLWNPSNVYTRSALSVE